MITSSMICLFGFTGMAVESTDLSKNTSEDEAVVYSCARTYSDCDELYPNDYNGFDDCMQRGGCGGDVLTKE